MCLPCWLLLWNGWRRNSWFSFFPCPSLSILYLSFFSVHLSLALPTVFALSIENTWPNSTPHRTTPQFIVFIGTHANTTPSQSKSRWLWIYPLSRKHTYFLYSFQRWWTENGRWRFTDQWTYSSRFWVFVFFLLIRINFCSRCFSFFRNKSVK